MSKNKLRKFSDMISFPNYYQSFDWKTSTLKAKGLVDVEMSGCWRKEHFKNENPLVLELACGGGEYTVGLSAMYPDKNFIGVDIKGNRIYRGAKQCLENDYSNGAFLRCRIEILSNFFEAGEVDEIWITFPDPFLRKGKAKKRLTSPRFLDEYRKVLKPGGLVHLKTDEPNLYAYTLEVIEEDEKCTLLYQDDDIYSKELPLPELGIKTYYEQLHEDQGATIKYVRYTIH